MNTDLYDLYASGQYNIDQISYVASQLNKQKGRFPYLQGKTFTILLLMLGEYQLADRGTNYLYIGDSTEETDIARHNFKLMLEHEGASVTKGTRKLFVGDNNNLVQSFWFYHANLDLPYNTRAVTFDKIFLDVTYDSYAKFEDEILTVLEQEKRRVDSTTRI